VRGLESVEREGWPEGVRPLDHTADVGLVLVASSLGSLFERAGLGLRRLIEGAAPGAGAAPRGPLRLELEADDTAFLLVAWLRELLFLHQVEALAFREARFDRLDATGLAGTFAFDAAASRPVREIKGVTYHALEVTGRTGEWRARVIFDV
jgi:SHS2 domain-containing protein